MSSEPDAPPKRSRNQYTKRAAQPPRPEGAQPVSTTAKRDTRFTVGNPGRPKGALNKTTMAVLAMMEGEGEAITRTAIDLAKAGDSVAVRLRSLRTHSVERARRNLRFQTLESTFLTLNHLPKRCAPTPYNHRRLEAAFRALGRPSAASAKRYGET